MQLEKDLEGSKVPQTINLFLGKGASLKLGKCFIWPLNPTTVFCLRACSSLLHQGQSLPSFVSKGLWIRASLFIFWFCMWNSLDKVFQLRWKGTQLIPVTLKVNSPRAQGSPNWHNRGDSSQVWELERESKVTRSAAKLSNNTRITNEMRGEKKKKKFEFLSIKWQRYPPGVDHLHWATVSDILQRNVHSLLCNWCWTFSTKPRGVRNRGI